MDVNFELYKVFYHAGKNLNYSVTAEELFVSQSSISQTIKQLENALGVKLFTRAGRGMKLTSEGQELFDHIEKAYHLIKKGEKNLESTKSLEHGTIRIGASDTISKYFLLPYIKSFHIKYPNVKIVINNRPSSISAEMIEKGKLDVGVININPDSDYGTLAVSKFRSFNNIFIGASRFNHLKGRVVSLKELESLPLITLEKTSTTRRIFDQFVKDNAIDLAPDFEFGSMDLIVEMTKINMGVGFVAEPAANEQLRQGNVFQIQLSEKMPKVEIGIVHNRNIPLSIAAEKFISTLIEG